MSRQPIYQPRGRGSDSSYPAASKASLWVEAILCCFSLFFIGFVVVLFTSKHMTIGGVPMPIILSFLGDETARNAYFQKDSQKLHDRLRQMGIEAQIKAFYRPKIPNEAQLDQHIHQLLYNRTGYVGEAYQVNPQGTLILKQSALDGFEVWFKLAQRAGLVTGRLNQNGIQYVVTFEGTVVPYEELAAIFSQAELESLGSRSRPLVEIE